MPEFDLVIRGGTVIDGTGLPRIRADIGIKDGRVAMISGRITSGGARELDASGCIVAPGAVDLHTHYDAQLNWDPYASLSGWFRRNLPDRWTVRLRVRAHPCPGPGPQHANDESHRGNTPGIHAPGYALGLGNFPRIHGQP